MKPLEETFTGGQPGIDELEKLYPLSNPILSFDTQQAINTNLVIWVLFAIFGLKTDQLKFNWGYFQPFIAAGVLTREAVYLIKCYVAYRLMNCKPRTALATFRAFTGFVQWLDSPAAAGLLSNNRVHWAGSWSDLDENILRLFLNSAPGSLNKKGRIFYELKNFYQWGLGTGLTGYFQKPILNNLETITCRLAPFTTANWSRQPNKDAFSAEELQLLLEAVWLGKGSAYDRAIVMLHLELGCNPGAFVQILNRDLAQVEEDLGNFSYVLQIPRVKKPFELERITNPRPISEDLGNLLQNLRQGGPDAPLLHWISRGSSSVNSVHNCLSRFVKKANIISPRTKGMLLVTSRRFRRTLATNLADNGYTTEEIADILDHDGLTSVNTYIQVNSSITRPLNLALEPVIGSLVEQFMPGTI